MSAAKGWVTKIMLQGSPADEDMEGSPAEAGQTTFYTRSFPVVDALGVVTDDEDEVTVYVDGVAQLSSAFTLTGATGKIVFGTAPGADKVITIDYSYKYVIAYGRSAEVTVDPGIEPLHVLNLRTPKEILDGAVTISGALERYAPSSRDWIGKVIPPDPAGRKTQSPAFIYLWPLGEETGKPKFTIGGVKYGPWTLTVPDPDTVVTEKLPWMGTSITPGTV